MLSYVFATLVALTSLVWIAVYGRALTGTRKIRPLLDWDTSAPDEWPKVSVIIPAHNESETLEQTVESLQNQDYDKLEIVVVDDRSTDGTAVIADRLAADSPIVEAVHIEKLPENWLGKVNALETGTRHASGDWLLFTDADVEFCEGAIRNGVAAAENRQLDHLTLLPDFYRGTFWYEVFLNGFGTAIMVMLQPDKVADPDAEAYLGMGTFNLVRKKLWEATEGFEWLRLEIWDDIGVGLMMSRHGSKSGVAYGQGVIRVDWHGSATRLLGGLEKNLFPLFGQYSFARSIAITLVLTLVAVGPWLGLIVSTGWVWFGSVAAILIAPVAGLVTADTLERDFVPALFVAFGQWLVIAALVRSTWKAYKRGGIEWGDRTYDLQRLRNFQRVDL